MIILHTVICFRGTVGIIRYEEFKTSLTLFIKNDIFYKFDVFILQYSGWLFVFCHWIHPVIDIRYFNNTMYCKIVLPIYNKIGWRFSIYT